LERTAYRLTAVVSRPEDVPDPAVVVVDTDDGIGE